MTYQVVGWLFAGTAFWVLVSIELIPQWLGVLFFVALVAKDLVLFPFVRKAYEHASPHGAAALVGSRVRVEQDLEPEGWVSAGAERWRARLAAGRGQLARGRFARVREIDKFTLVVDPADEPEP